MNRTSKFLSILIIATLALIPTGCSNSKPNLHPKPGDSVKTLNVQLVCAGKKSFVSDHYDDLWDKEQKHILVWESNDSYSKYVSEIFDNPGWDAYYHPNQISASDAAWGVKVKEDGAWFDGLLDQLDAMITQMSPDHPGYPRVAESGTKLIGPSTCWAVNARGKVVLGYRPPSVTTTAVTGPTITVPVTTTTTV